MMMLMRRRHSISGVGVVSFRAFLVAAYRGGGGDLACNGVGRSRMTYDGNIIRKKYLLNLVFVVFYSCSFFYASSLFLHPIVNLSL